MEREDRHGEKLDRLERALGAAHRAEMPLPELRVDAIMAAVRASAPPANDSRFLWRFLSAAAVAAVMLMAVNWYSGALPDTVALNQIADSSWNVLLGDSVIN